MNKILAPLQAGNRGIASCIATILASAGIVVKGMAEGQPMNTDALLVGGTAVIALFGFLKGKRIEAKMDAMHTKIENK